MITTRTPGAAKARLSAVLAALALLITTLGFGYVANAEIDEDIPAVTNLRVVSEKTTNNKTRVTLAWDAPDKWFVTKYRVRYQHDWRPQKWVEKETEEESVDIKGMWPGRLYTFSVQATTLTGGWGEVAEIDVMTPGDWRVPWVVSLGDSFIAGEAGRWAGNATLRATPVDTGDKAYFDYAEGETIPRCQRSRSALIHIGTARSMNLACSGAITRSEVDGGTWKPGIDFVRNPFNLGAFGPAVGQTQLLEDFARGKNVSMVALSIGGNNFGFSNIVTACVVAFLSGNEGGCRTDPAVTARLTPEAQTEVAQDILFAISNIVQAMENAGHPLGTWTLGYQLYPKPLPPSNQMRYSENTFGPIEARVAVGGCGMWNADIDWALEAVVPTINGTILRAAEEATNLFPGLRVVIMDASDAFRGHELCNKNVSRVGSAGGVSSWRKKNAPAKSEWVQDINIINVGETMKQESFHPNYWAQLALRACWRELWNGGDITTGGKCTPLGRGKDRLTGGPKMNFEMDFSLEFPTVN